MITLKGALSPLSALELKLFLEITPEWLDIISHHKDTYRV